MALTESRLRQIVREESVRVMREGFGDEPEDFTSGISGGYAEREAMARASEMGGDEDEEEEEGPTAASSEIVSLFRQRYNMRDLADEFSRRAGEVKFDELKHAVQTFVDKELGRRSYSSRDIASAASAISYKIQDYTLERHGGRSYRRNY
jgi:hypothetical protein